MLPWVSTAGKLAPVSGYQCGGKFKFPAGAWTDDTAMALALPPHSLSAKFEVDDVLQKFNWLGHGHFTSTGNAVGVGQHT